jgi:hypothetical protein
VAEIEGRWEQSRGELVSVARELALLEEQTRGLEKGIANVQAEIENFLNFEKKPDKIQIQLK